MLYAILGITEIIAEANEIIITMEKEEINPIKIKFKKKSGMG